MMRLNANVPEQPKVPPMPEMDLKKEYDRLYLEKCQEVNELERRVESYRSMVELTVKQKRNLEKLLEDARQTIREMIAATLEGFTPDVEPPEELPEALWDSQAVSSQDILCLSSALKNLYDIHKCDGWLLYNRLAKVLEKKIEEYCGED